MPALAAPQVAPGLAVSLHRDTVWLVCLVPRGYMTWVERLVSPQPPKQALANRRAPGTLYAMLVRQLIDALQSGIAPTDDAVFRELLRELSETIDRTLALTHS